MFDHKADSINKLLNRLRIKFGPHSLRPYGDWDDPNSLGFRIDGVDATFSVLVENQPEGSFDIQIESFPPGGDCIYFADVTLDRFMELDELISGPKDHWPTMQSSKR